ncbi:MAG: helix-turn-helix domain-containing protein [bacterium]|nr:helix-turn-helix domain-containing protein [bacterium]MDT8396632.1 helix-turn-helix domain-containing protein [bacterium]
MSGSVSNDDYRLLDLEDGATLEDVRRAYHRMKALYAESSLATYSLMADEERSGILHRIEKAYMRITSNLEAPSAGRQMPLRGEGLAPARSLEEREPVGTYLKRRREELGLTLKEVAGSTRIRSTYLEYIEEQRYSDLPALVYLRGFIMEFARTLRIPEPEILTAAYIAQMEENRT